MSLRVVGRLNAYEKEEKKWKRIELWWSKEKRMEIGWCDDDGNLECYVNGGGKRYEGKLMCKGDVKRVVNVEEDIEF